MDSVEKVAGPGLGTELLAQVGQRLDEAQRRTAEALRNLQTSFAGLDQRLRAAESRSEPEGAREAARFEKLAETLSRQVEGNRAEMMRRLATAESDGRLDPIEPAVPATGRQGQPTVSIIRTSLGGALGGSAAFDYRPEGLVCTLEFRAGAVGHAPPDA